MTPHHAFVAERALANHCAELLRPAAAAEDDEALVADFGEAVAGALPSMLAQLLGGCEPEVRCAGISRADAAQRMDEDTPAVHLLLGEETGARALAASLGRRDALALCDRVFGGTGAVADPPPGRLPRSAELALDRFGAQLAQAMAAGIGCDAGRVAVRGRKNRLERLVRFAQGAQCFAIELEIAEKEHGPWTVRLLADATVLGDWLRAYAASSSNGSSPSIGASRASPGSEPFAGIPLPLRAVLSEIRLPAFDVARLKPGDTIPLSLRSAIPLQIGSRTIATGAVGTQGNQVALRLSASPATPCQPQTEISR